MIRQACARCGESMPEELIITFNVTALSNGGTSGAKTFFLCWRCYERFRFENPKVGDHIPSASTLVCARIERETRTIRYGEGGESK